MYDSPPRREPVSAELTLSFFLKKSGLVIGLLVLPVPALAIVAELPRTTDTITIDGVLDEAVWRNAVRVDLQYETDPGENVEAPVATRAYLLEDGQNLYVAFEADDPEPELIRAYLRDRDSAWSDDYVGIILDTYNDERLAFEFYANPLGVQMDKTLDDTGGGNQQDWSDSWDAIWDSAGHVNDKGYVVEMRIPLSQLRFPDVEGVKTWGFDLKRIYPRDRTHRLSFNARDRNRSCYLCQIGKLSGLVGSRPSRDLEIVPTITATNSEFSDDPGFEPLVSGGTDTEAGVTVRWGITPDLTANITINPDFSQIESDVAQLDVNNRFALFYPEKRPFFLEGADYFNTPMDAVFTRTIAEPDFGAKLTGKKGDHTFGVFAAEDSVTNLLFPGIFGSDTETLEQSNTAFVGRYSMGFGEASSVGALVTLRDGDDYHNYLGGLDASWRITEQHSIEIQHLQTETEYPLDIALEFDQPLDTFSGAGTRIAYDYDSRDWSVAARYFDLNDGYRSDVGFETRVGGTLEILNIGRVFYGSSDAWWTRIRTNVEYEHLTSDADGSVDKVLMARFGIGGPMQSWFQVVAEDIREQDEGIFYDMTQLRVYYEFVPVGGLSIQVGAVTGDQIDYTNGRLGKKFATDPRVTWNMSRNLLLRLRTVYSRLDTQDNERIFDATLVDSRLTWQFNLRSFLRFTWQYQNIERNLDEYIEPDLAQEKDVGRQLLYSYKLNPQTVFFLGYSDQYIDTDDVDKLTAEDRTIFMKIGYAWTP